MRGEIKRLHQDIATTMIYVTHDQIEAMTLADRIVLMRDGRIEQMGSPAELFERPVSRFVAGFLGSPRMSFLPGRVTRADGRAGILVDGREVPLPLPAGRIPDAVEAGTRVLLGLRPEHVVRARDEGAGPGSVRIDATIELLQPTGSRTFATFRLGDAQAMAELQAHDIGSAGETIGLEINLNRASVFDAQTERAL
jgi:multiple sugar transport system ATP-binding protein